MYYTLLKFNHGVHYIMPGEKIVASFSKRGIKRVVCTVNDKASIHCAFIKMKEGGHYVIISSKICRQLSLKEGSKLKASFTDDNSEYQFHMPEELQEVLLTDELANKAFNELTPGKQRGLMALVVQVRSMDKRIERSLKIAEQLKKGISSPQLILKKEIQ